MVAMSKKIIAKSGGQLQPERPGHFHPEKGGQFHPEKAGVLIRNIHSFARLFSFFGLHLTTEAMGIWRFAGAFAVVERQSECGSKTC